MAQGVNKLVKFMLFFFNFIFFLCGLVLILVSSFILANYGKYDDFTGSLGKVVLYVFIAVGVFFFITGFFGCCGAMRENYCMLFMYATIIFVLLVIEIAAAISGFVLQEGLKDQIKNEMEDQLQKYPSDPNVTLEIFDPMQESLKCCGASNFTNWFGVFGNTSNGVPKSCCKSDTCDNTDIPETKEEAGEVIYVEGCASQLYDLLKKNMMEIIIICIVIGLVEITGIFCACCLMKSVKNEYEVV